MRFKRAILSVVVLSLGLGLTACESMDDFFSTKKPLPGERKALFPQGVPGVPQGVPADLVKGYQAPPEQAEPVAAAAVEKPKPAARPKPRPRQVAAPKPQRAPAAPPAASQATADPAFPAPQAPAPSAAPSNSPWPDPPKPGTFSR